MTRHLGTLRALAAVIVRTSALRHALLASVAANDADDFSGPVPA